jgi:Zinc knuckle
MSRQPSPHSDPSSQEHEQFETQGTTEGTLSGARTRSFQPKPRKGKQRQNNTDRISELEDQLSEQAQQNAHLQSQLDQVLSLLRNPTSTLSEPRMPETTVPRRPHTKVSDHPLPSIEIPREKSIEEIEPRARIPPEPSLTPDATSSRKTQLTEKIYPLDDGSDPTFVQWRISVRDRLEVNSDHYQTKRAQKALIWGATTGRARSYLEPRYLSEPIDYHSAEEMIDLLAEYYLTGNERAEKRTAFHSLMMKENETFAEFKSKFISLALQGNVGKSEWFFYCWSKITNRLRYASQPVKFLWKDNFQTMVTHLTSLDYERQQNPTLSVSKNKMKDTESARRDFDKDTDSKPKSSTVKPLTRLVATDRSKSTARDVNPPFVRKNTPFVPKVIPIKEPVCYNCGKPGHYRNDCPDPVVKEIEAEESENSEEPESEDIRSENEEA